MYTDADTATAMMHALLLTSMTRLLAALTALGSTRKQHDAISVQYMVSTVVRMHHGTSAAVYTASSIVSTAVAITSQHQSQSVARQRMAMARHGIAQVAVRTGH